MSNQRPISWIEILSIISSITSIVASVLAILSPQNLPFFSLKMIIDLLLAITIIVLIVLLLFIARHFVKYKKANIIDYISHRKRLTAFIFISIMGLIFLIYYSFYRKAPIDEEFALIRAGEHEFYMLRHEVTNQEYLEFLKDKDYQESFLPHWMKKIPKYQERIKQYYAGFTEPNQPVVGITCQQAKAYCQWLSQKKRNNYKLPTVSQWEFAARAGGNGMFGRGEDGLEITTDNLVRYAWFQENLHQEPFSKKTRPVMQKQPNAFRLYDIWGNAAEWTIDDLQHPSNDTLPKGVVYKGGSWEDPVEFCLTDYRDQKHHNYTSRTISFRIVCEP